jgi:hypothetical protein
MKDATRNSLRFGVLKKRRPAKLCGGEGLNHLGAATNNCTGEPELPAIRVDQTSFVVACASHCVGMIRVPEPNATHVPWDLESPKRSGAHGRRPRSGHGRVSRLYGGEPPSPNSAGPEPADMILPLDHRRLLRLSLGRGCFDEFAPRGANSTETATLGTIRPEKPKIFLLFCRVQIPSAPPLLPSKSEDWSFSLPFLGRTWGRTLYF